MSSTHKEGGQCIYEANLIIAVAKTISHQTCDGKIALNYNLPRKPTAWHFAQYYRKMLFYRGY